MRNKLLNTVVMAMLASTAAGCNDWPSEPTETGRVYSAVQLWPGQQFGLGLGVVYLGRDAVAVRFNVPARGYTSNITFPLDTFVHAAKVRLDEKFYEIRDGEHGSIWVTPVASPAD